MNCCFSRGSTETLTRTPLQVSSERVGGFRGFRKSGKGRRRFCCGFLLLVILFSSSSCHMHMPACSTSVSTWVSVVTFWLEVCRSVGRGRGSAAAAGAHGSSFVASRRGWVWRKQRRARLSIVKKRPQTMHMGDGAGQLLRKSYFYLLIFISSLPSLHHPLASHSLLLLTPTPSLSLSFLLQERCSTTWLHMEEWRKKRPGLNLDRYPAFSSPAVFWFHTSAPGSASDKQRRRCPRGGTDNKCPNLPPSPSVISQRLSHTVQGH